MLFSCISYSHPTRELSQPPLHLTVSQTKTQTWFILDQISVSSDESWSLSLAGLQQSAGGERGDSVHVHVCAVTEMYLHGWLRNWLNLRAAERLEPPRRAAERNTATTGNLVSLHYALSGGFITNREEGDPLWGENRSHGAATALLYMAPRFRLHKRRTGVQYKRFVSMSLLCQPIRGDACTRLG